MILDPKAELYPHIEPYDAGLLRVGDGHQVYWEICGNPSGKPALVLHGGPGSGCSTGMRRYFNPEVYRMVLFDQRGSGKSTPHASEPGIDLSTNTTAHLIADIERLRQYLSIEHWLVLGGSWGSTLALAYAERHPDRVTEMVLNSIATTTAWEIDWITRGVGIFFPEAWARFRDGVPEAERDGSLVDAYHHLLMRPDPAINEQAARHWCDWEMAIVAVHPNHKPHPRYEQPAFRLGFARLVTHYWRHKGWLEDGILMREANRLSGIRGVLIHGRLVYLCPERMSHPFIRLLPRFQSLIAANVIAPAVSTVFRNPSLSKAEIGKALFDRMRLPFWFSQN